jgi:hypothetical protein
MKTLGMIAMVLAAGCSDEADIGVSSTPVTCTANGFADVSGVVSDPGSGTTYDFDTATPIATQSTTDGPTTLTLANDTLMLRFGFYCGRADVARYGVVGDTQDGLDCPFQVASTVLGQIEILNAKSGTMIVDDNANCLAGRFAADFGSNGSISGSFSAPWRQPQQ